MEMHDSIGGRSQSQPRLVFAIRGREVTGQKGSSQVASPDRAISRVRLALDELSDSLVPRPLFHTAGVPHHSLASRVSLHPFEQPTPSLLPQLQPSLSMASTPGMAPSANLKAANATRLTRHFRIAAKSDPSFSARSCPDKGSPHQAPRPNRGGRRARRAVHAHRPGPRRTRGWRSADRKRLAGHRSRRVIALLVLKSVLGVIGEAWPA